MCVEQAKLSEANSRRATYLQDVAAVNCANGKSEQQTGPNTRSSKKRMFRLKARNVREENTFGVLFAVFFSLL